MVWLSFGIKVKFAENPIQEQVGCQVTKFMPLCWPVYVFPLFQALSAIYHLQAGRSTSENTKASKAKTKLQMKQKHYYILLLFFSSPCSFFLVSCWAKTKGPSLRQFVKSPPQLQLFDFGGGNIKVNEFTTAIVC